MPPEPILIVRPAAIGDTLVTFPALAGIRARFPGARVAAIGNRPALELARLAGLVDEVTAFGADWVADLFGDEPTPDVRARLSPFARAIVWMHQADAARDLADRLRRAGVPETVPLVSFPPAGSRRHLASHLVDTLAPLGVEGSAGTAVQPVILGAAAAGPWAGLSARRTGPDPTPSPPPPRGEGERQMTARFPPLPVGEGARGWGPAPSRDYVVLHPGAGGKRKRWPAEGFAEIARRCRQLGYDVLVTSGPADDEAVEAVVAACQKGPDGLAPRVLAGLGLPELACILAGASAFVGNDSGITHLAGLVGAPTVAIFGPFDPAYWAPLGRRVTVVDAGVACTHRQDPRDGCHLCNLLASLPVNSVWNAGLAALEASRVERGRA